jgi:hypothetical protein
MRSRDLIVVFLAAVVINAVAAAFVVQPAFSMDAYYYFGGALQLARGHGFTEPYVWNYLSPVRALPAPSHVYWMPLPSLVAAPFIAAAEWLAGGGVPNATLFRAAQIPMVLLASVLPGMSYVVAQRLTGQRRHALAAAALTVFSAFYISYWSVTDSFAVFGVVASAALLVSSRAVRPVEFVVAGVLCGLSHLARADGVLVLLCLFAFAFISQRSVPLSLGIRHLALLAVGYCIIMAPWFLRNLAAVGAPLAPNGTATLWLTGYNDLFVYQPETLTFDRFLASGLATIARDKWEALTTNALSFVATQTNIFGAPLVALGLWQLRRERLMQLALLYGVTLFIVMSVAFTFPGPRGGFFHSGGALLPFVWPAAVAGLDVLVEQIARVLKHWRPEKSKPIFTGLLVLGSLGLTVAVALPKLIGPDWRNPPTAQADAVYVKIGAWLRETEAGAVTVAVNNPPAFFYHTGYSAIVIPNGSPETLLRAMGDFDARWLVLDGNLVPELWPLYQNPTGDLRLVLRQTFVSGGQTVYLLERRE